MENKEQLNAKADVVKTTVSTGTGVATVSTTINSNIYLSKAVPKVIKFSSRGSVKIKDSYYTFEYGEERQITNYNEVNLDKEKQLLIDDCNEVVDKQIEEVVNMILKK